MLTNVKYVMVDVRTTAPILLEVSAVHVNLDLGILVKLVKQSLTTVMVLSNIAGFFLDAITINY